MTFLTVEERDCPVFLAIAFNALYSFSDTLTVIAFVVFSLLMSIDSPFKIIPFP